MRKRDRLTAASSLKATILGAAETLFPGYFALVMATAAVSIASFLLGHGAIAWLLGWLTGSSMPASGA